MREAGTGQGDEACWLRLSRAGRVRDFINVALKLLQIVEFCFNGPGCFLLHRERRLHGLQR